MSEETVFAVKRLIERRSHQLRSLHISWFGGEPLAAPDIVLDINRFAGNRAFNFSSDITTNATLIRGTMASDLLRCGLNAFQITLDGDKLAHDQTRISKDGTGSFDDVKAGISSLLNAGVVDMEISLRIHVTKRNSPGIMALLDNEKFGQEVLADKRVNVAFKAVEKLSDFEQAPGLVLKHCDGLVSIRRLRRELEIRYPNQITSNTRERAVEQNYICYASKPNSLAIRSNGSIAKCTVALYDERNSIGRLNNDGTVSIRPDKLRHWLRGWQKGGESALSCPQYAS
jgi:uncharacterized protein